MCYKDLSVGQPQTVNGPGDSCVLVFVRAPAIGKVKTRLAEMMDPRKVLDLYQCFVIDVLDMLTQAGFQAVVCYHPQSAEQQVRAWLGDNYRYVPQEGSDLGARMANAFKAVFDQGCRRALLIGTDFPDLPAEFIQQALDGLRKKGAVIGPADDGGYYLIGFACEHFLPVVFDTISWGTRQVLEATLQNFKRHQQELFMLPPWRDIDDYQDLLAFADNQTGNRKTAPHTRALLNSLKL
jgi:uncharacterized protein